MHCVQKLKFKFLMSHVHLNSGPTLFAVLHKSSRKV